MRPSAVHPIFPDEKEVAACDWLRDQQNRKKPDNNAPP